MSALCLIVFSGCAEEEKQKNIYITSPADVSSFDSVDAIPFGMLLVYGDWDFVYIAKGTIIEWTSDKDGAYWKEVIDQDIDGVQQKWGRYYVSYSHEFTTSALSAGAHTITCRANATDASGTTYNIATDRIRIYIRESQTSSTTTTPDTVTTTTTASADQRFTDNNNGTVTDTETGLIWLKTGNHGPKQDWTAAVAYCSTLANGMAGLTDGSTAGQWRLPSVEELKGIGTDPSTTYCLDYSCSECPVTWTKPGLPFTDVYFDDGYWSGTTFASNADYAWYVNMLNGHVNCYLKSNSGNGGGYVWPVREGR